MFLDICMRWALIVISPLTYGLDDHDFRCYLDFLLWVVKLNTLMLLLLLTLSLTSNLNFNIILRTVYALNCGSNVMWMDECRYHIWELYRLCYTGFTRNWNVHLLLLKLGPHTWNPLGNYSWGSMINESLTRIPMRTRGAPQESRVLGLKAWHL